MQVHAEIRRMWNRKKSLRRDSMALTRSFGMSSFRKQSFHVRGHNSVAVRGQGYNNNHHADHLHHQHGSGNDLRLTRTCSDSSSDNKSDDWLIRIKRRAQVIFWRKKSGSESRSGVIDTRYDCDGVPDIDAVDTFICNGGSGGSGDRMLSGRDSRRGAAARERRGGSDSDESGSGSGSDREVTEGNECIGKG